jgi:hypothetical protein
MTGIKSMRRLEEKISQVVAPNIATVSLPAVGNDGREISITGGSNSSLSQVQLELDSLDDIEGYDAPSPHADHPTRQINSSGHIELLQVDEENGGGQQRDGRDGSSTSTNDETMMGAGFASFEKLSSNIAYEGRNPATETTQNFQEYQSEVLKSKITGKAWISQN